MEGITAILSAYRRPHTLAAQLAAVRSQSVKPQAVWLWANEPDDRLRDEINQQSFDRVVLCSQNAFVHARFALALTAPTEYVAIFDDDTLPGADWLANCLETMRREPAILGSAGVRLQADAYSPRSIHGWHDPQDRVVEVDLVGHAWFLRTEWVHYLFSEPAVTGTNGEDIELSSRAWRLGGIRTFCPPHPPGKLSLWGSLEGTRLGSDGVAASRRKEHLVERDRIVQAEIERGWRPLFLRKDRGLNDQATNGNEKHRLLPGAMPAIEASGDGDPTTEDRNDPASPIGLAELVPAWVQHVLVIGFGVAETAAALRERKLRQLQAVELATARTTGPSSPHEDIADVVTAAQLADIERSVPDGPWDCVVCVDLLPRLRNPQAFLVQLRQSLRLSGQLVASVPNLRHHSTLSALLSGRWPFRSEGLAPDDPVRFFTKRELEKLMFRAGFSVRELRPVACPELEAWRSVGRLHDVGIGNLQISGLPPAEAEEFYAAEYLVHAMPRVPVEHGLTSIVLVTHNELDYTRGCLESIRYHTDEPYELIVVDNGSTDGTAEYLRSCSDVRLIENTQNRGFPAAANQGIEASRGTQILLLNNDTLVATGWLERMLVALQAEPTIGLVGPTTNYISGPQQVAAGYEDLADLDGFAWERGKAQDRNRQETDRLVGFCLLIRRELIDKIGKLDERFGIGNFEDDDYCLRARQAGFRAVIAQDSFIHHFGHCTFAGTGVDLNALLEKNQQLFREKWQSTADVSRAGRGLASDSGAAGVPARPAPRPRYMLAPANGRGLRLVRDTSRLKLSLAMIVRDNEATIRPCLESIRPWVDEMIVVDTGSRDRTPDICHELGAKVFHFPWCDDFSAARNESLKYARGEWIFWMDSDDTISAENGRKLRELARQPAPANPLGYIVQVHCPGTRDDEECEMTVVDHLKIFRNLPGLRFEGRIHEQILSAIRAQKGEVVWTDLFVTHSGAERTPEGLARKLERDFRLLEQELRERPDHSFVLFNLGMTHDDAENYEAAIDALRRCLAVSQPEESQVRKAYALLANSYFKLKRYGESWDVCQQGRKLYPDDLELLFREAMLHHQLGRLHDAVAAYQRVLSHKEERHLTSIEPGIGGFKARHNLAAVYTDLGWLRMAEDQWRQIVREMPAYRAGWRGLRKSLYAQGNFAGLGRLAEQLIADERLRSERLLCLAALAERRGDWAALRESLMAAVAASRAGDHEALEVWCQFLFEHGEPEEALAALEQLAERCPNDAATRHNLGTIYLRLKQARQAVAAFKESLRLRPDSAATWLHLGYAHKELDQFDEATSAWRETLRLEPGNAAAQQELDACVSTLAELNA